MSQSKSTKSTKSKVPAGVKQPQDRQDAQDDAAETVEVEWRGVKLTVQGDPEKWPAEAVLGFEEGKIMMGLRALIGPDQFAKILKTKPAPTTSDIAEVFDDVLKRLGVDDSGN